MFPLVLERRLSQHSVEFIHASPAGGPPVWGDCVSTVSAPRLLEGPPDVDAVVLGGGHLVHASPASFPHYDRGGLSPLLAYPALWLGAAHWAAKGERPFAWNAVGVPRSLTPSTSALVRWTLSVSDYVSVRDRQSARLLTAAGVEREVPVVVDTALEVSDLWTAEEIDEAGGSSTLWRAELTGNAQERRVVGDLAAARAMEYADIAERARKLARVSSARTDSMRMLRSLRRELRQVQRRDFFPPPERETARTEVATLARAVLNAHETTIAETSGLVVGS